MYIVNADPVTYVCVNTVCVIFTLWWVTRAYGEIGDTSSAENNKQTILCTQHTYLCCLAITTAAAIASMGINIICFAHKHDILRIFIDQALCVVYIICVSVLPQLSPHTDHNNLFIYAVPSVNI